MRSLLSLMAGLVAGATTSWFIVHQTPHPQVAATTGEHTSASGGGAPATTRHAAPALVLPPRLTEKEASDALEAYLALAPLSEDASPAAISERAAKLRALLTVLPTGAFQRLFEALQVRSGGPEIKLRWIAFDVWIERAPAAAAAWAASVVPSPALDEGARARYCTKAVIAWARADFDAAYAWATALSDSKLNTSVVGQLLADLAGRDPTRALSLAEARGPEFSSAAQYQIFQAWAKNNPAAALQTLGASILEGHRYDWQVQRAMISWMDHDPEAALAWGFAHSDSNDPFLIQGWQIASDSADPKRIADVLARDASGVTHFGKLGELIAGWSNRDPQAAMAWLSALPDAAQRADMLERVYPDQFIQSGRPDAYFNFLNLMPAGPDRDQKTAAYLAVWAKNDPDAALAWLGAHDGPEYASAAASVQGSLVGSLAATDPTAALARWATLTENDAKAAAIPDIANAWARTDPAAAAAWLQAQLPTSTPKLTPEQSSMFQYTGPGGQIPGLTASQNAAYLALRATTYAWSKQDPVGALEWAESLPDAMESRMAVQALDGNWNDRPPRSAHADLLAQITDSTLRTQMLSNHLSEWLRADLPAARSWIESHDVVAPELAAQLLAAANATPIQ